MHEYVLVAEDDEDVALLITQMLKNEGWSFKWACDGKEALELIAQQHPQLIITDIMMPEVDGIELIKAVRTDEETNHIPIIVVSARTENNDRLAGLDAGAEVYLGKPFIPDELLIIVRKLIEQRELLKKKYSRQIEEADKEDYNETIKGIGKSEQEFIEQINGYIRDNIMDCNLNASMLAAHMIMSITTLNRRINNITGTNTTNYIRQRKLARAKYLLKNSNMTMGEIQAVCGFESPSYFSRTFKAEFGITPTEYRKKP
ncbi:MAG: response regulator [Bacteroidaceae bacterium]|nr:response regulator [Bacteroidaceae bacterium]